MGAHVAGFCGKYINSLNQSQIGVIYATDAAGPCITYPNLNPENFRLVSTDASYVQVLHCTDGTFGVNVACGDADVYFNKGTKSQCGCGFWKEMDYIIACEPMCSHENCNLYFAYSLDVTNVFSAKQINYDTNSNLSLFNIFNCAINIPDFYDNTSVYMTVGINGQK